MRFYCIGLEEVNNLDPEDAEGLWLAITQIEAQDLLMQLRVADYPHMKDGGRSRIHREWHKLAYPRTQERLNSLSTKEFAEHLRGLFNGK